MTSGKKLMTSSTKPMTSGKKAQGGYAIGYGKPPVHTRFRKGQSGNPSGKATDGGDARVRSARALALEEAYRTVTVADGADGAGAAGGVEMPAIQAIMRRQIALALKGNGPAQRAVIAAVAQIEDDEARAAAKHSAAEPPTASTHAKMSDTEAARRVAFLLRLTAAQDPEFAAELVPELRPARPASWPVEKSGISGEEADGQ